MRLVPVFFLTACSSYGAVTVSPADNATPVGLGLTETYDVTQDICDGGVDGGCDQANPSQVAVTIVDGASVTVAGTHVDSSRGLAQFSLTGTAIGMSRILVMGDDGNGISTPISVNDVVATTLSVARPTDPQSSSFPDLPSPIYAFTGSKVAIAQHSVGPGNSPLRGEAALALDAGTSGITFDPTCNCFATGTTLGAATIRAPQGSLALNVVDDTAMTNFTLDGVPQGETLELVAAGTSVVYLVPNDSAGHSIVGLGPEPQLTIGDTGILGITGSDPGPVMRSLILWPTAPGTTTLDVQWGAIHRTFTLKVVSLDQLPPA